MNSPGFANLNINRCQNFTTTFSCSKSRNQFGRGKLAKSHKGYYKKSKPGSYQKTSKGQNY